MRILLIGNGAREHAIAWKLKQNPDVELYNVASANNPGLIELCKEIYKDTGDFGFEYAKKIKPDLVWVGPELPLQAGIVNKLHKLEIKCVGPTSELARLETSKTFTRELLVKNNIDACPAFKSFNSEVGLEDFVQSLDKFVVKPDGLTGGKGVRVQDDHFSNPEEGTEYAKECILSDGRVLIEEKLIGQEFSLMSYADG
ncbi:MAG: phosphoribosylamine--glycine ligase, partial [Patescibacteria group bacterium]